MNQKIFASLTILVPLVVAHAAEFHVATGGSDANPGTVAAPLRTIQRAADIAQPGDVITVHSGTYRERINPPRGGRSDEQRIVYQAAPGERVEIKGSEVVTNWVEVQDDVWQAKLPNAFFGNFNPYSDLIRGDWFNAKKRQHHTGAVYLNGDWLVEAAKLEDVLGSAESDALWFAEVEATNTTIWAQFKGVNPNQQLVEINVRRTVFYPERTGINFITVRGLNLSQAATPWSPPTAEQIGLIGTHWSKGWVIESNGISYSVCVGVTLGKYGDKWDNQSANSAEGYVKTIERALMNGWNSETVGHHQVRGNEISHCEQGGIVGSLGCSFSTITGNRIHEIHMRRLFGGAEMAGIKLHGAIDTEISQNHVYRCCRGLWLDWMAQGAHVSRNLFHDNGPAKDIHAGRAQAKVDGGQQDMFVEVNHGPMLVDNNLFLSTASINNRSQGGSYVHNLFAGGMGIAAFDGRLTPFLKPHTTDVAGLHNNPRGDDRYFNNLFTGPADLSQYDQTKLPVWMAGNVFLDGAKPSKFEAAPLVQTNFVPALRLVTAADGWYLEMKCDPAGSTGPTRQLVTSKLLGRAVIPNADFEQPDGKEILVTTDYFGRLRDKANPAPGPFEQPRQGELRLKVW